MAVLAHWWRVVMATGKLRALFPLGFLALRF
jgi:hypothetical protein